MDAEELTDGDYLLRQSDSLLDCSCGSRTLLSSAVSSDAARLAMYERLPHSVSSPDKPPRRRSRVGLWRILADAVACRMHRQVTRRHADDDDVAMRAGPIKLWTPEQRNDNGGSGGTRKKKKKKERRWSSWLPDPHRRWPVQGF